MFNASSVFWGVCLCRSGTLQENNLRFSLARHPDSPMHAVSFTGRRLNPQERLWLILAQESQESLIEM